MPIKRVDSTQIFFHLSSLLMRCAWKIDLLSNLKNIHKFIPYTRVILWINIKLTFTINLNATVRRCDLAPFFAHIFSFMLIAVKYLFWFWAISHDRDFRKYRTKRFSHVNFLFYLLFWLSCNFLVMCIIFTSQ